MANSSIYAAFERMWLHVVAKVGTKSDIGHTHDDYATTVYVDENFALKSEIENIDLSIYETKEDASDKLVEAKSYADTAANTLKNELLNGAGDAYDTLKELGDLINENVDAIDALETIAAGKASQVDLDNTDARVNELSANVEEVKENILPTVSNADNGKILAVVNGIWTAVSLINSEEVSY